MSNDRMTVVPDFLGELDAGVFMNKIAAALNTTALGVATRLDATFAALKESLVQLEQERKGKTP